MSSEYFVEGIIANNPLAEEPRDIFQYYIEELGHWYNIMYVYCLPPFFVVIVVSSIQNDRLINRKGLRQCAVFE